MIFAKDDNHATEIVDIAKNVFKPEFENDAIPEKFVQKITYSVGDSNALIRDLRTEKDFRIAVTVTLVATGTDVKPLEVVLFMKDVHSDVLYTQMKGRGCRVISDDKLKEVTPNADTKECYYIPDLAKDEIDKVAKSYPIILSLQQNKKYSDLLCVPFYLNLIVSGGFVEENINDENNFRNLIWERIICLKDKCRKYGVSQSDVRNNVERIVFERARSFVVGVDSDIVDSDILEALKSEACVIGVI